MKKTTKHSWLYLLPSLLGLVGLFLPFTWGYSALTAMVEMPDLEMAAQVIPGLLVIPILIWDLRRLRGRPAGTIEMSLAYVFGTAAMLILPLTFFESLGEFGLFGLLALANVLLLVWNWRRGASPATRTYAFLAGAYLPHVITMLAEYREGFFSSWGGWEIGAYFFLVACVGYVVAIVLRMLG